MLRVLATSGVYLGGGIPLHILPALSAGRFTQAFQHQGRLADLLANVPVHVIVQCAALFGAASYVLEVEQE
jgi:glucokinase